LLIVKFKIYFIKISMAKFVSYILFNKYLKQIIYKIKMIYVVGNAKIMVYSTQIIHFYFN